MQGEIGQAVLITGFLLEIQDICVRLNASLRFRPSFMVHIQIFSVGLGSLHILSQRGQSQFVEESCMFDFQWLQSKAIFQRTGEHWLLLISSE